MEKRFSAARIVFAAILLLTFVCVGSRSVSAGLTRKVRAHASAADTFIEATVKVLPDSPASVRVEGKFIKETSNQSTKNWSFLSSIAGVENVGARVSEFNLSGERNQTIAFVKLSEGEYLANDEAAAFQYRVNLSLPGDVKAMAHVSWLENEKGLLMLGDLLPQFAANKSAVSARIKFDLPTDWKIISSEKNAGEHSFEIKNVEKAIFLVGKNWRGREVKIGKTSLSLAIAGEWRFSDDEALKTAGEIYEEYRKLFGETPTDKSQIFLIRFPKEIKFGRWAAETRGANVTVLSSDMPFQTQSLQRLHEQLRHEILHLWMPNNLTLTGNYDWFYEGFTVYQALRTGVAMNQIRFEDYLDTLAQAYHLDNLSNRKVSLVESSKNRWSGANNQVYTRGMLAAFLCDVALLRASKGRRSIPEIFREIYRRHRAPNESEDGNTAILKILKNYSELAPVVEKYIVGAEKINWETNLESVGIEAKEENFTTKLNVKTKLSGRQKDLLGELGYNNWRKVSGIRR